MKSDNLQRVAVGDPRTLFIGDLHLSADRPDITRAFARFLADEVPGADALYILGDLFEAWIGDDDLSPFNLEVAALLHQASAQAPIFYLHGNRDFLIGPDFAKRAGITLLPEVEILELYGIPTVILHGDSLCTADLEYQKFRRIRNRPWFRLLMLSLPLRLRRALARRARARSKAANASKEMAIMDVTPTAVDHLLNATHALRMIHGHTHRPAIHRLPDERQRVVVGDWYLQESVLLVTPDECKLSSQALPKI
ncbi:UDP-2,3-diacylglucosamine diphosphatase [Ferrimonas sediminicola]|uniref:UDP-2,3-diacylglucosamine hydrolase n=1 Tax=Ferrimonas sediminicola TaxID=2569538 RepID=A0A4U1BII3_9GAMM|nr:UDP-2,3-diacylglucosamine diphosphatase [Ferrimonas sediminicola]TKB49856.1 UDP-2,3-diacylglucosamine diphosphatase [Ferrimonas sediminicola]